MIKILKILDIERTGLNIIKNIYNKSTANIILNGDRLKAMPLISGTSMLIPTTPIQHRKS